MKHIAITIPKSILWTTYSEELRAAESGDIINYKVSFFPKGIEFGKSRCYVVHDGMVKGWMTIVGFSEAPFRRSVTGKQWIGKFICRSGVFHDMKTIVPMNGFRGFRYVEVM